MMGSEQDALGQQKELQFLVPNKRICKGSQPGQVYWQCVLWLSTAGSGLSSASSKQYPLGHAHVTTFVWSG